MVWHLFPPKWRPDEPGWIPLNEAQAVSVNTLNDGSVGRTSGWCVVARTTQAGGSIAIDFDWPLENIVVQDTQGERAYGGVRPSAITMTTWIRSRPNQTVGGTLAFWDLTQSLADTVPFVATQAWQFVSLSAAYVDPGDKYRVEIYLNDVNVDLLLDRTVVA
jgi:hypothetical protein